MSDRNCWATPPDLFAELHAKYNFTVDACALPWNAKLPRYWAPPNWFCYESELEGRKGPQALDGLAQDWSGERVWCNPPYGRGLIGPWVEKALQRDAELTVLLLPSRTDTNWFQALIEAQERDRRSIYIDFLATRIHFVPPPGVKASSPTEASILVETWE